MYFIFVCTSLSSKFSLTLTHDEGVADNVDVDVERVLPQLGELQPRTPTS